ncbi:transcription factor bHLH68-like isoform X1 [Zingiber officinale]|uniref:transcription factor bHLH68-like isoform X1 n=1 Tax=Zingiber officinale TaxID=94328 RepID=UPI001C4B92A6|nr:transcription factor bHLH68-like isoform X1 [Zingiber officinale]
MNRGGAHHHSHHQHESSLVQQMMIERSPNPSLQWSINDLMMMPPQEMPNLLSSTASLPSPMKFPKFLKTLNPMIPCHDLRSRELPAEYSWSQLLLGNLVEEGCTYAPIYGSSTDAKGLSDHELKEDEEEHGYSVNDCVHFKDPRREDDQGASRSPWSSTTQVVAASSPRSCVTTSFSSNNILDFSNGSRPTHRKQNHQVDHSSPDQWNGNYSGASFKKARVQASSVMSPLKVRKEKLGDRIAALHQLVSPFGKTDTASVLLEAIGYIRFLHGQIQALSSPYLGRASRNNTNSHRHLQLEEEEEEEEEKDLRSRGLCLVPASFTLQVEKDNAADFWAANLGTGFMMGN